MLTERQQAFYDFIVEFRQEHGCSPSIPEMQKKFSIASPNGVTGHLQALESKGFIRRSRRGSRQVDLMTEPIPWGAVPLYGQVPAGPPQHHSPSSAERWMSIDEETLGFKPKAGCYALTVRGDSMKEAGILDGDTVIIDPNSSPDAGTIVVALIDGENTLKRLVRVKGKWFLKAENAAYPELIPKSELVIQGMARMVIRRLD